MIGVLKYSTEGDSNFSYKGARESLKYIAVGAGSILGKSLLNTVNGMHFRTTQYQRRRISLSHI